MSFVVALEAVLRDGDGDAGFFPFIRLFKASTFLAISSALTVEGSPGAES
jgi:hypothetical protein